MPDANGDRSLMSPTGQPIGGQLIADYTLLTSVSYQFDTGIGDWLPWAN